MRRFLWWLFPIAAMCVGASPVAEMATCMNGVCTIKESDWIQFQAFHAKTMEVAGAINEQTERLQGENNALYGALARCQSQFKKPV